MNMPKEDVEKIRYQTTDLGEAAALICCGHAMIGLEELVAGGKDGQFVFAFPLSTKISLDAKKYQWHDLRIDPQEFFFRVKDLKSRVRRASQIRNADI